MNWPGEQLIIKLWDTLSEKGIGGLLKPWEIRREGIAEVDVRRYELLALAAAEKEAQLIRSGAKSLRESKYLLSLTSPQYPEQEEVGGVQLPELASRSVIADAMRKEANVAKAVLQAEAELKADPTPPPKQQIEDDWLHRWRESAGQVSAEELQALWGKILAGELKSPGSYSYRLLDFIRNLTRDEAALIEKIAGFVINGSIAREPETLLESEGITFDMLLSLQELGVVAGVESLGMANRFDSVSPEKFVRLLLCNGKGLFVEHDDKFKTLELGAYIVTSLGKQVMGLGKFSPSESYLRAVGKSIKQKGYKVSLVDCIPADAGRVRILNQQEIEN